MSLSSQQYADLAEHTYDRDGKLKQSVNRIIDINDDRYRVLEVMDRPSGYQGAIYQKVDTGEIVAAHRGTEFDRQKLQDLVHTDGSMVLGRLNPQADDAIAWRRSVADDRIRAANAAC